MRKVAYDVLYHNNRAFHHHAEIERAQREEVRRDVAELKAGSCKQQGKRDRQSHDQGAADVAKKEEKDDDNKEDALGQIMKDRMSGEVNEVTPVKKWDDFHARRQNVRV